MIQVPTTLERIAHRDILAYSLPGKMKFDYQIGSNFTDMVEDLVVDETVRCGTSDFTFNFSSFEFPNPQILDEPLRWEEYTKIVFYAVILAVALVGNVGVILTVVLNRSMRTTINLYLVNLAAADLFICVCCMWVPLANSLTKPMFVLGPFMCKFNSFAQMTCLTSSVLTLSAISCDRFIAILFPLHVRITKQRTGAVISIVWLVSMLVSVPFLVFNKYVVIEWRDVLETNCHDDWPSREAWDPVLQQCVRSYPSKQLYYTFVTLTLFFLPAAIMATAYLLIIWRLWKTQAPGERNAANIIVQHRAKKKVIKMVCVVLCGFIVCWLPMQITVLYAQFGHSSGSTGKLPYWFDGFNYFATFLAYFNSALNPILYGGFNHNFRQGLYNVLRCTYGQPHFPRPQFSQKSRTTMSGVTGSPSTCRVNGVASTKMFELRSCPDVHTSSPNTLERSV